MRRGEIAKGTKTALVTGASKGIGRCYALRLADLGYNVVMVASTASELTATADEVRTKHPDYTNSCSRNVRVDGKRRHKGGCTDKQCRNVLVL